MAAPSISSHVVEDVAQDILNGASVADICRKFKFSQPTVRAIKKGEHKNLSSSTRNKLVTLSKGGHVSAPRRTGRKRSKVVAITKETPRTSDLDTIKIAQENMRLRNSLHEISQKIAKIFGQIGDFQACA